MRKNEFESYIKNSNFYGLFNELGWDNTNIGELSFTIDDNEFAFKPVVEKRGFLVYTCYVEEIPKNSFCKRIDTKLKKYSNDYILIFIDSKNPLHHQWTVPVKNVDKRNIVNVEYGCIEQTGFLYSKADDFFFDIEEETNITDVTKRVHAAFDVNSEKVTKDFYAGFKKQHDAFANFVSGISVEGDKQWYVSVMLNRLMFCYFIQKKNFLDFNPDYLREKLNWSKEQKGKDKFFKGFYKNFLTELFEGGLNNPEHNTKEFKEVYGKIPYLNGGMFDKHQIEKAYENIDIEDEAFENLFDFFDKYRWHLDTRIEASGKDINPDVLGYIFEQYINDRSTMGAYYTKEDITNYIGRNCIIPYLFEKTKETNDKAFEKNGFVWNYLKNSGTKYIYSSVLKGWSKDWKKLIPDKIAKGLKENNSSAEKIVSEDDTLETLELIQNRREWNKNTDEIFGLPTEIWRETIERLERCDSLVSRIENGEIYEINDFITYNLDIVSFTNDLLVNCDDLSFVKNFYTALTNVTILDPTCGSGAFLFAALNILEPLYDVCLDKMEELGDISENEKIKKQYRSNREYFIYKTIILHNLYGVDIMNEATEIAKLRLFLKMVAVVEADRKQENLGLDPLPDIDFNIRCGNTLVGCATTKDVKNVAVNGDMFARVEFENKIENELKKVSATYKKFIESQRNDCDFFDDLKKCKTNLNNDLASLNKLLNTHLYCSDTGNAIQNESITENQEYQKWISKTKPFHWAVEFYNILENGGFDVIIGNPPYVEYSKVKKEYKIHNIECIDSGNLYAFVIERSLKFSHTKSRNGMIIQMSAFCTPRMETFEKIWFSYASYSALSFYDDRPGKLFDNLQHIRVVIPIMEVGSENKQINTTGYNKFYTQNRNILFNNISYYSSLASRKKFSILKLRNTIEESIANKLWTNQHSVSFYEDNELNDNYVYYGYGYGYFGKILNHKSYFYGENVSESTGDKYYYILREYDKDYFVGLLNSSLFYWFYINYSDGHNFTKTVIGALPYDFKENIKLKSIVNSLMNDLESKKGRRICNYKSTGRVEYDEYYPKKSKSVIDQIDTVLAAHYGFTQEELDFIINYDIKYRMGDSLSDGEEE